MAARKMTFSIPDPVAREFLRSVPARNRSKYVSEALAARLKARDAALARACDAANASRDLLALERDFDAISGDIAEPWTNAETR